MAGTSVNNGLKPTNGSLTFDSEGQEGGPYHSRVLHVPSSSSGLTIGRGYDMKEKSSTQIYKDLTAVGVADDKAKTISKAAGLAGDKAKKFITDNNLASFDITAQAQLSLFEKTYSSARADVDRICTKADTVAAYGSVNLDKTHPAIVDMLVDLRFRGDYTPASRKLIQKHAAANDLVAFQKVMVDKSLWSNVPKDRFDRRVTFINAAVAEMQKAKVASSVSAGAAKPAEAIKSKVADATQKSLHHHKPVHTKPVHTKPAHLKLHKP